MRDLSIALTGGDVLPGEAYLDNTSVLAAHSGTQPDLFLRWNRIPSSAHAIDVVVFLHGFSQQGRDMLLAEKVERSGLDLSGRSRPTLAMLPRGNWIRHYHYDFPSLLAGGIDRLVDYGLSRFSRAIGSAAPGVARAYSVERFILAAHSGGGMPAVDAIAGASRAPDELHVFDGLYGRDPARGDPLQGLEILEAWLADRLRRDPEREGALRVVYIEQQTGPFSRKVAELIAQGLSGTDPARAASMSRRYRVETSGVQHSQIARRCMPELLAAPDAQFNWLE
jgi:pimeloyl-ACP methyl ester carboxylesterase